MLNDLLIELIKIDSSTQEGANRAVEFCQQWLEEQDLPVQPLTNNGYKMLVCEIGKGPKTLIFNGHVDVVSGKQVLFTPFEKEGKLYGRGAADMKAGVAAMMCAAAELNKHPMNTKIYLQIVSDEEIGGFNCSKFLTEQGYKGDFVICAEPTQLGVGLQAKGILQLSIEVSGKSAHGSRPWEGVNAIEKAYHLYEEILNLPFSKERTDFYPSPSINLAKIQGGDAFNKVPDTCMMDFDIRFLPTQTKEEIINQIQSITDGKLHVKMTGEPVRTQLESEYMSSLLPIIKKYTKQEAHVFGQHGSADTRFFSAFNIPAIEFGPSGANWHGDQEYVILESVTTYKKMLIDFALTF